MTPTEAAAHYTDEIIRAAQIWLFTISAVILAAAAAAIIIKRLWARHQANKIAYYKYDGYAVTKITNNGTKRTYIIKGDIDMSRYSSYAEKHNTHKLEPSAITADKTPVHVDTVIAEHPDKVHITGVDRFRYNDGRELYPVSLAEYPTQFMWAPTVLQGIMKDIIDTEGGLDKANDALTAEPLTVRMHKAKTKTGHTIVKVKIIDDAVSDTELPY